VILKTARDDCSWLLTLTPSTDLGLSYTPWNVYTGEE